MYAAKLRKKPEFKHLTGSSHSVNHFCKMQTNQLENIKRELELKKAKAKFEKAAEKKAAKKAKKSAPKEEEEVVTDAMTEDAPIDETDVLSNMNTEEAAINESFLKMQKLAGVITEAQYNQKKRLIEAKANDSTKNLLKAKLQNDTKLKELMKKVDEEEGHLRNRENAEGYTDYTNVKKAVDEVIKYVKEKMGMTNLEADYEDIKNAIK